MIKKALGFLLLSVICALVWAQNDKAVVKIEPLVATGASPEEKQLLETLIYSYLSDNRSFVVFDADEYADGDARRPDYVLKSSLYPEKDSRVFELVVSDASFNEVYKKTAKYKTMKDIALNLHSIVNTAFEFYNSESLSDVPDAELIGSDKILGLWRGDSGIELVRILPDGKAFAFFSSGVNMMLSYRIDNNNLVIKQVSPNHERFYYPLPLPIAKKMAANAEPMQWEFLLYENGSLLKGQRIETSVKFEDYENITIIHKTARPSEWYKLPR
jgi:hypothetical protein